MQLSYFQSSEHHVQSLECASAYQQRRAGLPLVGPHKGVMRLSVSVRYDPLHCRSDEYVEALVRHARHADTVVLGRAVGWKPSEDCARRVEEQLTKHHKLLYRVQLDFSGNTFVKSDLCLKEGSTCPWTSREMSIFVRE